MRRKMFYLVVALTAFGIGFYFAQFYIGQILEKKNESKNWSNQEAEKFVSSNNSMDEKTGREKFLTEKEKVIILFEPTLKRWLKGEKLDTLVEYPTATIHRITNGNYNAVDENSLLSAVAKNYKPFLIDVNNNGENELAILSNCSPPEFCELRIFKKTENDFQIILSTYTDVENFSLKKNKTKGYFDIETTHTYPGSKTSLGMKIYKFNGEEYEMKECFDYIYLYEDKNGELHKLSEPKFIPLHCC